MKDSDMDKMTRVFIISFCAFIGLGIGACATPPNFSGVPLLMLGFALLGGVTAFVTLLFVMPMPKTDTMPTTTPPASVTPPLSPELTSQINDIVNSGREPALIVEELRRLTEARP